jgi:hypothetical protein
VASEPVSDRELTALHERISRDLAALRRRLGRGPARGRRPSGDLVTVAVEMFRVVQAARGVAIALRPAATLLMLLLGRRRPRSPR